MELIVLLIGCALLIGLFLRKKGDNTMDTLGKGCGCMFWFIVILIILIILYILLMNGTLESWIPDTSIQE
ncbi:hypothetical protein N9373_02890 [Flavobacteriaceae bacterium]|jgi:uncharacterized membrane protein YhfC|nr:hypothetical protein [Flavobacteriaceae bacterium]